eukprot:Opistho-2@70644
MHGPADVLEGMKEPGAHNTQTLEGGVVAYDPELHGWHWDEPWCDMVPFGHVVHAPAEGPENCPAWQGGQSVSAKHCPDGHDAQFGTPLSANAPGGHPSQAAALCAADITTSRDAISATGLAFLISSQYDTKVFESS